MKRGLLLFLLVFALPLASAQIVHNEWHPHTDNFEVDGISVSFLVPSSNIELMRLDADDFSAIIPVGECRENQGYWFCYEDYDTTREEASYDDRLNYLPAVRILIERDPGATFGRIGELNITKLQLEDLIVGDTHTYEIRVLPQANTANIRYQVSIPQGIEITNQRDFNRVGNNLVLERSIPSGWESTYRFDFRPINRQAQGFDWSLTGTLGDQSINEAGNISMSFLDSYELLHTAPDTINLGETFTYRVNLTNLLDQSLDIEEIKIILPDGLEANRARQLRRDANVFTNSINRLNQDESGVFEIDLTPNRVGSQQINVDMNFSVGLERVQSSFSSTFEVEGSSLAFILSSNKEMALIGSQVILTYEIRNPNEAFDYTDISTSITSSLGNEDLITRRVRANSSEIFSRVYTLPDEPTQVNFSFTSTYLDEGGEQRSVTRNQQVSTTDRNFITITQEIDKELLAPGDDANIIVRIRNNLDETLRVESEDSYSTSAVSITGSNTRIINLEPRQETDLYAYNLRLSSGFELDSFDLVSTAQTQGRTTRVTKTIPASQSALDEIVGDVNGSESVDEEEGDSGDFTVQTSQGFFSRFWEFLANIFKSD